MAFPSVTPTGSKPGAIQAIYVRTPTGKFQTLGGIVGGSIDLPDYEEMDSMNRNRAHAVQVKAKANMQQASLIELELLDSLVAGGLDFLFKLSDAVAITSSPTASAGWVLLANTQVGVKPTVSLKGGISTTRKIALDFSGSLTFTEHATAIKPELAEVNFASSADSLTFSGIGVYSATADGGQPNPAHIVPNGISSITMADVAGGSAVTMGAVNNYELTLEYLSDTGADERNRHECTAIKVTSSFDWRSTDAASLLLLKTMDALSVNTVHTMASGLIMTLNNIVGISTSYTVPDNIDKNRSVKFKQTGSILSTSIDAVASGS